MQRIASLFMNNRSQALRIPKEFELPGTEVTISQQADGSLIVSPRRSLLHHLASLGPLAPEDALGDIPPEPPIDDVTL